LCHKNLLKPSDKMRVVGKYNAHSLILTALVVLAAMVMPAVAD
jgi:hypothetical protein